MNEQTSIITISHLNKEFVKGEFVTIVGHSGCGKSTLLDLVTFQEAGPAINEAYASSELDMAIYGEYPAATAYSNGVDIRIIGVAD